MQSGDATNNIMLSQLVIILGYKMYCLVVLCEEMQEILHTRQVEYRCA